MNDQQWAAFIGVITVVAVRILDWILPRGKYFRLVKRYGTEDDEQPERRR